MYPVLSDVNLLYVFEGQNTLYVVCFDCWSNRVMTQITESGRDVVSVLLQGVSEEYAD